MLVEDDGLTELEQTVRKVSALLELLSDKFDHLLHREGSTAGPHDEQANRFNAGVGFLTLDAKQNLSQAFEKVFRAAHALPAHVGTPKN